ncbi:hypothetical protein V2J09_010801 [Rumex salicifolius]
MAEARSPNPTTAQKSRPKIAPSTLQSPTSPFFLGSNDDNLERAQARAARAAALRRKSLAAPTTAPPDPRIGLGKQQVLDLFNNCIKLASENKINQKNTWELNLIDHLCDIIKVEEEEDIETNFQKASCTLEAGVKIYSLRVDSVHSEAYKVLGGINRVGHESDQDHISMEADARGEKDESYSRKEIEKMTPTSTLESSFEALNVKKFDAAFSVDPLYHQTSAQFDEGGAKGLLLNNLGVYGSCKVLFDSSEVPGKCIPSPVEHTNGNVLDVTFAKEYIEQMVFNMKTIDEISPTLNAIVHQFDDDNRREELHSDDYNQNFQEPFSLDEDDYGANCTDAGCNDDAYEYSGCNIENDNPNTIDQDPAIGESFIPDNYEGNEDFQYENVEMADEDIRVDTYPFLTLENTKENSWAGPEHWKYRKPKGVDGGPEGEKESPSAVKKSRSKKKAESDIDFCAAPGNDIVDVFAPPKNLKSLLQPPRKSACSTKLPEDCHYKPEDLVKLFLLQNMMCLGKRKRRTSGEIGEQTYDHSATASWGDENGYDGPFNDGNEHSDVDESDILVNQPRQVNKIEVQYDRTSKQVDVQALKEVLWDQMKDSCHDLPQGAEVLSFKGVLTNFPSECRAASTLQDISPHLCFICLLHLANEHGLRICGSTTMDDLTVQIP